ncbi:helix-turn-helix transcriptional regulator [Herbidospora sp. NBRC 101105]|uniref:helix-turn-helix transcriptional regulator n=1 Tax=Herbidospora sp. NBRC 101105 TaxID=3032195 RepID=UPI0024A02595|nr:helix-turn-helix transcriptional regulator [Herbidospora sp. NBRC 101105]GLX95392.1 transcriptional regulator [Herbidospora sp. NBRC 101105]
MAVGEFLRARRDRITPEAAGLPADVRPRRVPGLRREEVASLAGVSVDYYVKLERGLARGVSRSVWEALARALRLDETERAHLWDLVAAETGVVMRREPLPRQRVTPGLRNLLATLDHVPAMVQGRRTDVLASNTLFTALYAGFTGRNLARFILLDPAAKDLYPEWPEVARSVVAVLRLYAGAHPDDPELTPLVDELTRASALFRQVWNEHAVVRHADGRKRFRHPVVGELTLNYETFTAAGDPEQTLVMFHADPGSPSADALRLLGAWHASV